MEVICDEERCSLGHHACFACFLIVAFIIHIYVFNNSQTRQKKECMIFLNIRTQVIITEGH